MDIGRACSVHVRHLACKHLPIQKITDTDTDTDTGTDTDTHTHNKMHTPDLRIEIIKISFKIFYGHNNLVRQNISRNSFRKSKS